MHACSYKSIIVIRPCPSGSLVSGHSININTGRYQCLHHSTIYSSLLCTNVFLLASSSSAPPDLRKDDFFKTRIHKYNSTVFRTNMPPGSFIASNPKVIAVLDAISFPILFDTSKVEKRNVLDGTYMPSTSFTGGHRVCAYLDPSEANHASLKRFFFSLLAAHHRKFIPLFQTHLKRLFLNMESQISENGNKVGFNALSDDMSFNFVFSLFCGSENTSLASKGPSLVAAWLLPQLAPQITLGSPKLLSFAEDFLLHTFPYPSFLVKSIYKKLYNAFYESASSSLDDAEKCFEIPKDEACHNLVFLACFNAFRGYHGTNSWKSRNK